MKEKIKKIISEIEEKTEDIQERMGDIEDLLEDLRELTGSEEFDNFDLSNSMVDYKVKPKKGDIAFQFDKLTIEDLKDKNIVISGDFEFGTKKEMQQFIESKNGINLKGVTLATDIVIVGNKGSESWTNDNCGSKVKKALDFNERRKTNIKIISESDILN